VPYQDGAVGASLPGKVRGTERNMGDWTATDSLAVVAPGAESPIDLSLTVSAETEAVPVETPFAAVYLIDNPAVRAATSVIFSLASDDVPAGMEIVSAKIGWFGRPCTITKYVSCPIGPIGSRKTQFVVVTLRPLVAGPFSTVAGTAGRFIDHSDEVIDANLIESEVTEKFDVRRQYEL